MKALFISYNGLLEPLLYSQGLTYLRELSKLGNTEMTVLSFEKLNFPLSARKKEEISSLEEGLKRDNIRWHRLRYHKFPPILSSFYDIIAGTLASLYLVRRDNIGLVHARSYVPAVIAYFLHKLLRVKYIFDMRGFMIDDYASLGIIPQKGLLYRLAKRMEKALLEGAACTVILTEEGVRALPELSDADMKDKKVEVIPCCVDKKRFCASTGKDTLLLKDMGLEGKFVFIYAGSLGKLYMFDKMLDFFSVARAIIPNAHLLILTPDTAYVDALRKNGDNGRLFDSVSYLSVKPQDIAAYLSLGDAGIAFYLPSFSRKATSPTKIGEYLISGVPFVVNSGVGDTGEWAGRYGIGVIVKDFTEPSYREAVESLLKLKREGPKTKNACREASERLLSLDMATEKYYNIYGSLVSEGKQYEHD